MELLDVRGGSPPIAQPQEPRKPTDWKTVAIIALLLFVGWNFMQGKKPDPDGDRDRQEDVIDDKTVVDLKDAWVVMVFERTSPPVDVSLLLNDHAFWASLEAKGMKPYRPYDDDQHEAAPYLEYARGRGVDVPAVFLVKDKRITAVAPLKDKSSVERLLK